VRSATLPSLLGKLFYYLGAGCRRSYVLSDGPSIVSPFFIFYFDCPFRDYDVLNDALDRSTVVLYLKMLPPPMGYMWDWRSFSAALAQCHVQPWNIASGDVIFLPAGFTSPQSSSPSAGRPGDLRIAVLRPYWAESCVIFARARPELKVVVGSLVDTAFRPCCFQRYDPRVDLVYDVVFFTDPISPTVYVGGVLDLVPTACIGQDHHAVRPPAFHRGSLISFFEIPN